MLGEIAGDIGMTMADVAFLAGLDESTVSRLWSEEDWLDRVKGRTLQAIISAIPGVVEALADHALTRRRRRLIEELAKVGLHVHEETFRYLVTVEQLPEQWVSSALEAALYIMRGDDRRAAACLARFWGRQQDRALGFIWQAGPGGQLFTDTAPLLGKSLEMAERLGDNGNSFHAMLAHATFVHHIVKSTGDLIFRAGPAALDRRNVMSYRSGMMGRIIQTGDVYDAEYYCAAVRDNTLLSMLEGWALPTFTRDAAVTTDFSIPRSMLLKNSAENIAQEIDGCNDAYLHYLVTVAIPMMRHRDPTLGLRATDIRRRLRLRMETSTVSRLNRAGSVLLGELSTT